MKSLIRYTLAVIGLVLFGCSTVQTPTNVTLPLAEKQPTFLLFYTDN